MIFQKELNKSLRIHSTRTAIESGPKLLTYGDVLGTSTRVRNFLLNRGLESQTLIGIQLDDRADLICAMIGVVNARCIFVPLNAALPDKVLSSLMADLKLGHLITSKNSRLPERVGHPDGLSCYFFEDIVDEATTDMNDADFLEYGENDSIYVYFTSGTTGKPKGIVGRNCSMLQFARWEINTFGIDQNFRFSQFISPFFDAFLRDVFVPMLAGGTICIPPDEPDFFSPLRINPWIEANRIHLIHCVPSLFRIINHDSLSADSFQALRYVLLSGERIIPAELTNWFRVLGSRIQLVNLYGTTETTMIRACHRIMPGDVNQPKIPIGSPIDDTELLVAGKDLVPCNKLVPGDLYIVSKYVTNGYLNAPELNQQKFFKITSSKLGEAIAFKTGDKARILANGQIDLIGREDRQVKINGIRVELDEIEYFLHKSGAVSHAVVVLDSNGKGTETLLAFAKASDASLPDGETKSRTVKFLKENLPGYMIPSEITVVKEFPLLPNGKIDHKALLKISRNTVAAEAADETEKKLIQIWKEILGDKPISIHDNFQTLGGNSLSIMRLIGKIYQVYNVRIPLSELFRNLTIRSQAVLIRKLETDRILVIPKTEVKPAYVLSSAQERIYFNYELNRDSTAYNLPLAWEIRGNVDIARLERTLKLLVERHESLRTKFEYAAGGVVQVVVNDVDVRLEKIEASGKALSEVIAAFVRPFDLSKAPLLRCGIINRENGKKVLVVDIHHIVCDGISQAILFADFLKLYNGEQLGRIEIQYKDYAAWEKSYRQTEDYLRYKTFWLNSFKDGIPRLDLPSLKAMRGISADAGNNVKFRVEKQKISGFISLLKESQVPVFSGLISAFFIFLSKLTSQDDIVIGTNASGRTQASVDNVVGMFVKTLPVRFRLSTSDTFKELVLDMHAHLAEVIGRQVYDLADIVATINKDGSEGDTSLFDVMFVFQNFNVEEIGLDGTSFTPCDFENATSKYPMTFFAWEDRDHYSFRIEYASSVFTAGDAEMMAAEYRSLLETISANTDAALADLFIGESRHLNIEEDIHFNF